MPLHPIWKCWLAIHGRFCVWTQTMAIMKPHTMVVKTGCRRKKAILEIATDKHVYKLFVEAPCRGFGFLHTKKIM